MFNSNISDTPLIRCAVNQERLLSCSTHDAGRGWFVVATWLDGIMFEASNKLAVRVVEFRRRAEIMVQQSGDQSTEPTVRLKVRFHLQWNPRLVLTIRKTRLCNKMQHTFGQILTCFKDRHCKLV